RDQLGTVGSGNHYVDIFHDDDGVIWVGVHFGSRGFGHTVASSFRALSQGGRWGDRGSETEILLPLDAPLGHDYWHLMELAGRYAYVGREWVARKVVDLIGGTEQELVHNHHNFAWRETHEIDGVPTEVTRPCATCEAPPGCVRVSVYLAARSIFRVCLMCAHHPRASSSACASRLTSQSAAKSASPSKTFCISAADMFAIEIAVTTPPTAWAPGPKTT